ncbi:MAG TPA: twin-arginine translocase TatA/TatE family subunit [Thermoleophilaceae bacterium]|jgi:sec-independent protein translocase protein TatA
MVNVGPLEMMLVAIIALIVLGPARLPEVARSVGRGMREFRSALTGAADYRDDDEDDDDDDEHELEPPDDDEDDDAPDDKGPNASPQAVEPAPVEPPPLPRTPPGAAT